jgi:CheY-like chemotaxis protein
VARILICEPHPDIRSLLSFVVRRLGHEPILCDGTRAQVFAVDLIVVEPGDDEARSLAAWTRKHAPNVGIVCASIFPPWEETDALKPDAYLVKPFPLSQLEQALCAMIESHSGEHAARA